VMWWFSRDRRVFLLFSIQCGLYAVFCGCMISFLQATTIPDAQGGMTRCFSIGSIINAVVVNFYALLGGRRDRAFRGLVTGVLVSLGVLNLWLRVRGTVIELQAVELPGGAVFVPIRTPPGALLVLNYLT